VDLPNDFGNSSGATEVNAAEKFAIKTKEYAGTPKTIHARTQKPTP
jgi:hypothetical protein